MNKLGNLIDRDSLDLLRKSGGALFVKIFGTALSLGFYMLVSRQLEKDRAGEFFLSMTLTIIIATLARWGLDNAVTRNAAMAQASGRSGALSFILKYSLVLVAVLSFLLTALLLITARPLAFHAFHNPNLFRPLQLTAISILPLALYTIQFQFLQGLGQIRSAMLLISFWPQLFMLLPCYFVVKHFGVDGAIFAYTLGCVAALVIGFLYTRPAMIGAGSERALARKELFTGCNALFVASLSELLISWVPVVLVGMYSATREVAEFSVAQRLSMLLGFFFYAVNTTASAKIATNFRLGKMDAVGRVIRHSSIIMTAGAAPVFVAFTVFPKLVLRLFGDGFVTGAGILVVLSMGQMVNVMTGPVASALVMCGKERIYSRIQISSAIVSCVFVLLGLRWHGAFGAAIGVAIAIALKNISCSIFVWTSLKVAPISLRFRSANSASKRILLVGYYGSNFGDLIMMKTLLDFWHDKAAKVSIFTYGAISPATLEIAGDSEIYPLNGPSRLRSLYRFLSASMRSHAVVWGGGTCFMDEGGEGAIKYFLLAKLLGAKVYYLGIGVGNAKRRTTQLFLRLARLLSKRIVVRDEESARKLGGMSDIVRVAPDLSFAVNLRESSTPTNVQRKLLIAYRCLDEYLDPEEAAKVLAHFIDRIIEHARDEEYSAIEVLDTDSDVDRDNGNHIFDKLKEEGLPVVRITETSAMQKLKHIAAASVIVTGRLHVGVFAAELGRPFLIVNYSPKIDAFARAAGATASLIRYSDLQQPHLFTHRLRQLNRRDTSQDGGLKRDVIHNLELLYASF